MRDLTLNKEQIRKVSDIVADIGLVSLASVVIPSIVARSLDKNMIYGITITLISWFFSIIIRK